MRVPWHFTFLRRQLDRLEDAVPCDRGLNGILNVVLTVYWLHNVCCVGFFCITCRVYNQDIPCHTCSYCAIVSCNC